jgi:hypothetical protein
MAARSPVVCPAIAGKTESRAASRSCQEGIAIPFCVPEITLQTTLRHSRNLPCIIARLIFPSGAPS